MVIKISPTELKEEFITNYINDPNRINAVLYTIKDNVLYLLFKYDFEFFCKLDEKAMREFWDNDKTATMDIMIQRFHTAYLDQKAAKIADILKYEYL